VGLEIINQFYDENASQKFINQNLNNIDFRYMAIKSAMATRGYDKAISLCIEGENENRQYPGIIKTLQEMRYAAYEGMGNKTEQKALALTLLLDGEFDYFLKYKNLYSKSEWENVFNEVLKKTEKAGARGVYLKIITHEKHKPRILAYCEKYQNAIVDYHSHILPEFKLEVGQIFTDYIRRRASGADNRGQYSEVCNLIKICDKACPGATDKVCAEIIQQYARKPAFMDEMRKIKKL